jgi:hypothetical protein
MHMGALCRWQDCLRRCSSWPWAGCCCACWEKQSLLELLLLGLGVAVVHAAVGQLQQGPDEIEEEMEGYEGEFQVLGLS